MGSSAVEAGQPRDDVDSASVLLAMFCGYKFACSYEKRMLMDRQ